MQRVPRGCEGMQFLARANTVFRQKVMFSDLLLLFICIISETSKMRWFVENDLNRWCSGMYYNPCSAFVHREVGWQMETQCRVQFHGC